MRSLMRRAVTIAALAGVVLAAPRAAAAQWTRVTEQFYLPAAHNWVFRRDYPGADRLFNAFDYGHAILYETLWTRPNAPASRLEEREFDYLTRRLLPNPPKVPLVEEAIEPLYARLAPEAKAMFEWAHLLHRQLYDVLADERLGEAEQDAEVARLLRYYRSRPDLAFSARPKSMALMQEQPYSLAFRQRYPKFNGLIWAYHWLQVGLYEPLVAGRTAAERRAGVAAAVARFNQMLADAPRTTPYQMPMTPAVAPRFDAVIHPPPRLQVCGLLAAVDTMDFAAVRDTVGVSDSVLSKHVKQLEEAGYVRVRKATRASRLRTSLALTAEGRAAFDAHVAELRRITGG